MSDAGTQKGKSVEKGFDLDDHVLAKLPPGTKVLSIAPHGASLWVQTVRIDTRLPDGTIKIYFKKGGSGERGRMMMEGTFESETAFYSFAPKNVPKPVGWGTYKSDTNSHFYICDFQDMIEDLPDIRKFPALMARIHLDSMGKSPTGKFGFHVTTHLANIPNDNSWRDTWEEWYSAAIRRMLELEEKSRGSDPELTEISKGLLEKVIPRLLRPLQTGGREIKPCLIHSDLWPGNVMPDAETEEPIIFDSCAFWGHNEADLGTWRSPRYRLGKPYIKEYLKHIPVSAPVEDFDDRNALYAMRYNMLVSTMNKDGSLVHRQKFMSEAKKLLEKYPNGIDDFKDKMPQVAKLT
ncbi:hypothetical protein FGG08_006572 [Glutinoglossum americanum]|uniref:protein-ribulosamine 3-kinase n=1 Tax=Glutinoglossum americanum TaxID=1670608 RepID=A0A9P8HSE1_9PEZI|nr:hypothetical protein FGG08_006572 [Glutinoglossum americanum]